MKLFVDNREIHGWDRLPGLTTLIRFLDAKIHKVGVTTG